MNTGSHYEKMGVQKQATCCASNAAVSAITRCLAEEWASDSIRTGDVAQGFTLTDLNRPHMENARFPSFIARAILYG